MSPGFEESVRLIESRLNINKNRDGCMAVSAFLNQARFEYLSSREQRAKTIVVAGTNGKGSFCASLQRILMDQGFRVGLFTSPHLKTIRERIRINDELISEAEFAGAFDTIQSLTDKEDFTRFELLTLMAIEYFRVKEPDFIIFEVGIGGRKDASNAVPHGVSVITRLGLDHTEILGGDLETIAREKLGIFTSSADQKLFYSGLPAIVEKELGGVGLRAKDPRFRVKAGVPPVYEIWDGSSWSELALLGRRGAEAAELALDVAEALGAKRSQASSSLAKVNWPGRMDCYEVNGFKVYLSGDHNPQGMESLVEILGAFDCSKVAVVGIGDGKDGLGMLKVLAKVCPVLLTQTTYKTAYPSDQMLELSVGFEEDWDLAFQSAQKMVTPKGIIVITGSLYLVGAFLEKYSVISQEADDGTESSRKI